MKLLYQEVNLKTCDIFTKLIYEDIKNGTFGRHQWFYILDSKIFFKRKRILLFFSPVAQRKMTKIRSSVFKGIFIMHRPLKIIKNWYVTNNLNSLKSAIVSNNLKLINNSWRTNNLKLVRLIWTGKVHSCSNCFKLNNISFSLEQFECECTIFADKQLI